MSYKKIPSVKSVHIHTHTDSIFNIPIFSRLYEFYNLLTRAIGLFPKAKRYTLGQELDRQVIISIELLVSIPLSQSKLETLKALSVKLDLLKILLRLSRDNQCLREKDYILLQAKLQEIGRMLGGWIRSQNVSNKRLSQEPTSSSD
ncbi:MAG: hypothetical protein A2W22_00675 [Candidatus Levybacteria bacterium RBG_16_35_11]|nr:MAG: hypothetical protein A2W22_00675 [Candidatus Levybacteria bacterium RBG_16_35_11]